MTRRVRIIRRACFGTPLALALVTCSLRALAQEKKDPPKKPSPTITTVTPMAVVPGAPRTLKIRGQSLADATSVKLDGPTSQPAITLKSKGKSDPPKATDAAKAGDTEVVAEVNLPADALPGDRSLTVVTPTGESQKVPLLVLAPDAAVEEKEPNNAFKGPQELPVGKTVVGAVQDTNDVDLYRFAAPAGTRIRAEVSAARRTSLLDASLTLYDARGHVLATADDSPDSRDPVLRATLPADGLYYLGIIDANERGSPLHTYVLSLTVDK